MGIILLTTAFYIIFVCVISTEQGRDSIWITSPKITPWGTYGPVEFCPLNSFVTAMKLKVDHEHSGDNSALNGIQLRCSDLFKKNSTDISSVTGMFGEYGATKPCVHGFATGFQLRSQNGQGFYRDDVAAVDFKLICTDVNGTETEVIDDANKLLPWGAWTEIRRCPPKSIICGLTVQAEMFKVYVKGDDETSINNVDIACCPISQSIQTCQLAFEWETLDACQLTQAICEAKLSAGVDETRRLLKFRKFYEKFVGDFYPFVKNTVEEKTKNSGWKINGISIVEILSGIKISNEKSQFDIVECEGVLQQLVVECGVKIYTHEYRCVPNQLAGKITKSFFT